MEKLIQNKEGLLETVHYIATETSKLAENLVGKTFPIKSLTIFSHSESEYELLTKILGEIGKVYSFHNGPRAESNVPIIVGSNKITHLRIRQPDPERPQVGCNDFETNYENFKKEYLHKCPNNLRVIVRPEYEMIEFFDPEFNVLAYVVSN